MMSVSLAADDGSGRGHRLLAVMLDENEVEILFHALSVYRRRAAPISPEMKAMMDRLGAWLAANPGEDE